MFMFLQERTFRVPSFMFKQLTRVAVDHWKNRTEVTNKSFKVDLLIKMCKFYGLQLKCGTKSKIYHLRLKLLLIMF